MYPTANFSFPKVFRMHEPTNFAVTIANYFPCPTDLSWVFKEEEILGDNVIITLDKMMCWIYPGVRGGWV